MLCKYATVVWQNFEMSNKGKSHTLMDSKFDSLHKRETCPLSNISDAFFFNHFLMVPCGPSMLLKVQFLMVPSGPSMFLKVLSDTVWFQAKISIVCIFLVQCTVKRCSGNYNKNTKYIYLIKTNQCYNQCVQIPKYIKQGK